MTKWDHPDDRGCPSRSSLEAAAEAAAKVNAMLIAKGKLKPSQLSNTQQTKQKSNSSQNNLEMVEVDINDVPISCRNLLTRGSTQDEISKMSGAAVSTRGRYISPEDRMSTSPSERPLYLCVQGPTLESVEKAVTRIREVIAGSYRNKGSKFAPRLPAPPPLGIPVGLRPRIPVLEGPPIAISGPPPLMSLNTQPAGIPLLQDKCFLGLEHAPPSFDVKNKVLGPAGSYLGHIQTESGAKVLLQGKGSGCIDPLTGREILEPMHILLQHPTVAGIQQAKQLADNLVQTVQQEYAQFQQMLAAMPPPMVNGPPTVISMPPQTGPPPGTTWAVPQPVGIQQTLPPGVGQQQITIGQPGEVRLPPQQMIVTNTSIPPPNMAGPPPGSSQPHIGQSPALGQMTTTIALSPHMSVVQTTPSGQPIALQPPQIIQAPPPGPAPMGPIMHQLPPASVHPHMPLSQPVTIVAQCAPLNTVVQTVQPLPGHIPGQIIQTPAPQPGLQHITIPGQPYHLGQPQIHTGPPMMGPPGSAPPVTMDSLPPGIIPAGAITVGPPLGTPGGIPVGPPPGGLAIGPPPGGHPLGAPSQGGPPVMLHPPPVQVTHQPAGQTYYKQYVTGGATEGPPTTDDIKDERPHKRRFTEEKKEEKLPENLLGYQHGPSHLAVLNPSVADAHDSVSSEQRNEEVKDDKQLMPPPPPPFALLDGALSNHKKLKTSEHSDPITEVVEEDLDVKANLHQQLQETGKYSYNQYSSKPQLYGQECESVQMIPSHSVGVTSIYTSQPTSSAVATGAPVYETSPPSQVPAYNYPQTSRAYTPPPVSSQYHQVISQAAVVTSVTQYSQGYNVTAPTSSTYVSTSMPAQPQYSEAQPQYTMTTQLVQQTVEVPVSLSEPPPPPPQQYQPQISQPPPQQPEVTLRTSIANALPPPPPPPPEQFSGGPPPVFNNAYGPPHQGYGPPPGDPYFGGPPPPGPPYPPYYPGPPGPPFGPGPGPYGEGMPPPGPPGPYGPPPYW